MAFREEFGGDLLGGVTVLRHRGVAAEKPLSEEPLYRTAAEAGRLPAKPVELTFIPYYAWANRGVTSMEVWIPLIQEGR